MPSLDCNFDYVGIAISKEHIEKMAKGGSDSLYIFIVNGKDNRDGYSFSISRDEFKGSYHLVLMGTDGTAQIDITKRQFQELRSAYMDLSKINKEALSFTSYPKYAEDESQGVLSGLQDKLFNLLSPVVKVEESPDGVIVRYEPKPDNAKMGLLKSILSFPPTVQNGVLSADVKTTQNINVEAPKLKH